MRGEMEMDFIQCEECGEKATVFDDGRPYCQKCYDKIVRENMEKNGVYVRQLDGEEVEYQTRVLHQFSVPLSIQQRLLEVTFKDTAEWIRSLLGDKDFLGVVRDLAERRLVSGYNRYGSNMYKWDKKMRYDNILQELADAFVYKSSGYV